MSEENKVPGGEEEPKVSGPDALKVDLYFWLQALVMALVGLILPPLRFLLFQMPPLFPTGIAMAFEMGTYGLVCGLLYGRLQQNLKGIYLSLIAAMIAGRIVWGIAQVILMGLSGGTFTFQIFITQALLNAIPAIILQLIIVPAIVAALRRARLIR